MQKNIISAANKSQMKTESELLQMKNAHQKQDDDDINVDSNKFVTTLDTLKKIVSNNIKEMRDIKNNLKKLETMYSHDVVKVTKSSGKKKKTREQKPTGFGKMRQVPDKLADLIKIERGTIMSRPEFTQKFYKLLGDKKLYYEGDKRVLRVDNEISKALDIPMSVNNSTHFKDSNGFNFFNVQKFIAKCYNEETTSDDLSICDSENNHEVIQKKNKIANKK